MAQADAATSLHRALRVRSGRAVAVAEELADLKSARQQVAAAARRRRRGPHRQDSRACHGAGGRRARGRERGDAAGSALHLQQGGLMRGGGRGRGWRRRSHREGGDASEVRARHRRWRAGKIRRARVVPLLLQDRRRLAERTFRPRDASPAAPSSTRSSRIPSRMGGPATPALSSRSRRGRSASACVSSRRWPLAHSVPSRP